MSHCRASVLPINFVPRPHPSALSQRRLHHWRIGGVSTGRRGSRVSSVVTAASGDGEAKTAVIIEEEVREGEPKRKFEVYAGKPLPLGSTSRDGGVNFAVYSSNAVTASLRLFSTSDLSENKVTGEISLDPFVNRTGDVWHLFVKGDLKDMVYGYVFDGKFSPEEGHRYDASRILLDPYAKAVVSRGEYGALGPEDNCWPQMAGMVPLEGDEFDWEGDLPLNHQHKDLIIYELHVRGFTRHESSNTQFPGTYLGVVDKLDHLKELGVNCIELMPCQEFNELEYFSYNSVLGDYKYGRSA